MSVFACQIEYLVIFMFMYNPYVNMIICVQEVQELQKFNENFKNFLLWGENRLYSRMEALRNKQHHFTQSLDIFQETSNQIFQSSRSSCKAILQEATLSGVTGGGAECPPETSDREISADLPGKREVRKKWKMELKRRNIKKKKRKVENWKWKEKKLQNEERTSFFFFAFHFSKSLKFVLSLSKWEFSTEKKHFTPGKKSGKMTLPPLKNILLMPLATSFLNVASANCNSGSYNYIKNVNVWITFSFTIVGVCNVVIDKLWLQDYSK